VQSLLTWLARGSRRGRARRLHSKNDLFVVCSMSKKTYRRLAQSELQILAILNTLDQALNDAVVQSNGKGLRWNIGVLPRRALQEETAIWNFECHDRSWCECVVAVVRESVGSGSGFGGRSLLRTLFGCCCRSKNGWWSSERWIRGDTEREREPLVLQLCKRKSKQKRRTPSHCRPVVWAVVQPSELQSGWQHGACLFTHSLPSVP
jgi:hypothetical protein